MDALNVAEFSHHYLKFPSILTICGSTGCGMYLDFVH